MVHLVAMQEGAAPATRCGDPFGEHFDHSIEIAPCEIAVRIGSAHKVEEFVLGPLFAGRRSDDLLRQNIQRRFRNFQPVQLARADRPHQGGAFEQLIASGREQATLRQSADPVTRATDPLQSDGDRARRSDLAN